jgi:hypothetical protein
VDGGAGAEAPPQERIHESVDSCISTDTIYDSPLIWKLEAGRSVNGIQTTCALSMRSDKVGWPCVLHSERSLSLVSILFVDTTSPKSCSRIRESWMFKGNHLRSAMKFQTEKTILANTALWSEKGNRRRKGPMVRPLIT